MSKDMIALDNFFHVSSPPVGDPDDPKIRFNKRASYSSFTGPKDLIIPKLHRFH